MLLGYSVLLSMTPQLIHTTFLQVQQPKPIYELIFLNMVTEAQIVGAIPQVTRLINAGAGT